MTNEDKNSDIKILKHIAVNNKYEAGVNERIIRKQKKEITIYIYI